MVIIGHVPVFANPSYSRVQALDLPIDFRVCRDRPQVRTIMRSQTHGKSYRFGNNRIGQNADLFDLDLHLVARFKPQRRFPCHANAFRRAG